MQIFRSLLIFRKQIYQKIDRKIIEIIINKDIKNIYIFKLTVTCTVSIFAGDDFCVGRKAEKQREKKKISNSLKEQITIIKKKKARCMQILTRTYIMLFVFIDLFTTLLKIGWMKTTIRSVSFTRFTLLHKTPQRIREHRSLAFAQSNIHAKTFG